MSWKVPLLVVGLFVGGAIGWATAPTPAVDINVGGVSLTVDGSDGGASVTAGDGGGSMRVEIGEPTGFLPSPGTRSIVFAIIGGIVGFGIGVVADRRKLGA